MPTVNFEGHQVVIDEGQTLLEALLDGGHAIPNGCRSGVCQACLLVADEPNAAISKAQQGLSDAQRKLNQFLSCQCRPEIDLEVQKAADTGQYHSLSLREKTWLNQQVLRLRFESDFDYLPGQYLTLWKDETTARSYSIASVPAIDDFLEIHIKVIDNGQFSQWAATSLNPGDTLKAQGPMGKCIYTPCEDQPLFMAAIGTGLAPIYGILRDALDQGHSGPITLVLGAMDAEQFYLVEELQQLQQQHSQLQVHFVAKSACSEVFVEGDVYEFCRELLPNLKEHRVYLCGAESFVKKMRKQSFLAGAGMANISADVFLPFAG